MPSLEVTHMHTTDQAVKVKSSMGRSLPVENLLPQNVGLIINYLQLCTEAAQWELLVAVNHNSYGQWRHRR